MIKEEWESVKNSPTLPISVLYEYWNENKKEGYADMSLEKFEDMFTAFTEQFEHRPIITPGGVKAVNMINVQKRVFDYFNTKFQ